MQLNRIIGQPFESVRGVVEFGESLREYGQQWPAEFEDRAGEFIQKTGEILADMYAGARSSRDRRREAEALRILHDYEAYSERWEQLIEK